MKTALPKLSLVIAWAAMTLSAQDAKTVLENALKTMGDPQTIEYSGTGMNAFFGQALTAGKEWPRRNLTSYSRRINYGQKSSREDFVFEAQVFGGQRQNQIVNGDRAWTDGPNGPVPQLAAADERQLQIWLTPHGFLKGALASGNATVKSRTEAGKKVNVVTFTALGKYKVEGTIDSNNLVIKTETHVPNPVLGDTEIVTMYSDYKDWNGVKFPQKIVQIEGGYPVNEFTVDRVQPNAPVDIAVPPSVQAAAAPPVKVESSKIADGVWFLGGGSHHSVVVEFDNYTAIIEAPLSEERSLAVIGEAKKLVPGKPIRYLINTHHHFDHSGGLRTYAAEGVTIITDDSNKAYFEKTLMAPATLAPDEQAKARKKPKIIGVKDRYELSDGKQKIDVYATKGDTHTNELMIAYLPGPKILVEADSYSPGPPNAPAPPMPPPNAVALYDNIQRLKLEPQTIVGIHGRGPVSYSEFLKFIGKSQS
jgi:glyoxylase-like metal-dependent hydrolase (beta-lactamase superfamily II)